MPSLEPQNPDSLTIADLQSTPGLTDQYDDLLFNICDTTHHGLIGNQTLNITDASTRFCLHLRRATNADTVYLCNRTTLDVVATSASNSAKQHCADTQAMHNALTSMISDLWNCTEPFNTPDIRVYADEPQFSYAVIPLDERSDRLAILVSADESESVACNYIAHAISVVYDLYQAHEGKAPSHARCESNVFDALQSNFQNSSNLVTAKRLQLFSQLLKAGQLYFDNIFTEDAPSKALSGTLTNGFYQTAQIWGADFTTALDLHYLTEASYGYKTLCESDGQLQFATSRPLELKVHASSLGDPVYIDALRELLEKSVIHASRLQFAVVSQLAESAEPQPEALTELLEEFGAQQSEKPARKREPSQYSIADEFDVPGVETGTPKNRQANKASRTK